MEKLAVVGAFGLYVCVCVDSYCKLLSNITLCIVYTFI